MIMIASTRQLLFFLKFLTVIILLHLSFDGQGKAKQASPGDRIVTIATKNQSVREIFKSITSQTGLRFSYNNNDFNQNEKISSAFVEMKVEQVLKYLFAGKTLSWVYIDNVVRIGKGDKDQNPSIIREGNSQKTPSDSIPLIDVSGQIVDTRDRPIAGATVSLRGQTRGQGTDLNGGFMFTGVSPNATLVVSSIGYETKQYRISGQKNVRISLDSMVREIQAVEVVSTGYQNIPKERATGSFVQINNKLYNEQVGTNFLDRLPAIASSVNTIPGRLTANQVQVTVRGISTITGPQGPLIVVDNFPYEGDINNINPNDIENINILRDAAAASIWGTKAGNGVIVITTKKGKFNEKVRLDFNANVSVAEKPDLYLLNDITPSDYIEVEKFLFSKGFYNGDLTNNPIKYQTPAVDILERERKGLITSAEATAQLNNLAKRDIRDEYTRNNYSQAVNQQYALNVRGGTNTMAWVVSAGLDKNANELSADYKRYTFRIDNIYKPINKLQFTTGVTYTKSDALSGKNGYRDLPNRVIPMYTAFSDANGNAVPFNTYRKSFIDTVGGGRLLDWRYNPLDDYNHATVNTQKQDLLARFGVRYQILKWLTVDLNYQLEKQTSKTRTLFDQQSFFARDLINRFSSINYQSGAVTRPIPLGGILDLNQGDLQAQNFRGQINVDHRWKESALTAIIGSEARELDVETNINRSYGYNSEIMTSIPVDYLKEFPMVHQLLGTSVIPANNSLIYTRNRFVSFYSNVAYTLKNKYTVSASARRDASNLFGVAENDRWNPLWSSGLAWEISNEDFYKSSLFPYLKLRATYGFSGNVSPNASSVTTISYFGPSIYTNTQRSQVSNFKNDELTWEKVGMLNFGVDFRLKNRILSGSLEFYKKYARDLYGVSDYDRTLGLGVFTIQKNSGSLNGTGADLILNSINIDRKLVWTTDLNLSYYNDKIIEYYTAGGDRASDYVRGRSVTKGYPRYPVFSYKWAGLDPLTGNPQGYLNGKVSTNYTALTGDSARVRDLNFHGSAIPKYYGSLGNTISYKNITLSVRLSYQLGFYFTRNSINYLTMFDQGIGHSDFAKRWQKAGDEKTTTVPSMIYSFDSYRNLFYLYSEPLVEKGDHVRLQYCNIGYTLNKENARWLPLNSLKMFFVVNNAGIIWRANKQGIDPLYPDSQLPPSRNYSFGISANL